MIKYFLEIRNRLFLLTITWLSVIIISYFYKEILLFALLNTHKLNVFYFIFTNVTEIFIVYIKIISFLSNQILILYFCYHSFVFISSATFKSEYACIRSLIQATVITWIFSIIFLNYIVIPATWNFFLSFQNLTESIYLHFEARLIEYLTFYVSFYYLSIFYNQTFLLLIFSLKYTNTSIQFVRRFRKLYYYLFILFSTLFSPPEIFTQIIMSSFIIIIYELSFFIYLLKTKLIRQPIKTN